MPSAKEAKAMDKPAEGKESRDNGAMKREVQVRDNEGGHMSSSAGRVTRAPGADLPYMVTLAHHRSESSEHRFATMREAEAFIQRNTPVPGRALSSLYDRPASDFEAPAGCSESSANDEDIFARLKMIAERLEQVPAEAGASVLASGMTSAGIPEQKQLRFIAETERILDELDGKNDD